MTKILFLYFLLITFNYNCLAAEGESEVKVSYVRDKNGKIEVQNMQDENISLPGSVGLNVFVGDGHGNSVIINRSIGQSWESAFMPNFTLKPGGKVQIDISEYSYGGELMKYDRLSELVKSEGLKIIGYQIYEGGKDNSEINDYFILSNEVK